MAKALLQGYGGSFSRWDLVRGLFIIRDMALKGLWDPRPSSVSLLFPSHREGGSALLCTPHTMNHFAEGP